MVEPQQNGAPSHEDAPEETNGGAQASAHGDAIPLNPAERKVQELEAQLKDKEQKYVYLYADFENFKKRAVKERSDAMKFGWENAARDLVEVIDNLERGLAHMPEGTDKNLAMGLNMTLAQFRTALQKQGVQLIDTKGQAFNPELHEAIAQEPSDQPEGMIVREQLKGYLLHGRLLRPANVVVSAGPLAK